MGTQHSISRFTVKVLNHLIVFIVFPPSQSSTMSLLPTQYQLLALKKISSGSILPYTHRSLEVRRVHSVTGCFPVSSRNSPGLEGLVEHIDTSGEAQDRIIPENIIVCPSAMTRDAQKHLSVLRSQLLMKAIGPGVSPTVRTIFPIKRNQLQLSLTSYPMALTVSLTLRMIQEIFWEFWCHLSQPSSRTLIAKENAAKGQLKAWSRAFTSWLMMSICFLEKEPRVLTPKGGVKLPRSTQVQSTEQHPSLTWKRWARCSQTKWKKNTFLKDTECKPFSCIRTKL